MIYKYGQDIFLTYQSQKCDLHVRVILHERLFCKDGQNFDHDSDNSWSSNTLGVDRSHGNVNNSSTAFVLPRQEAMDGRFEYNNMYYYSKSLGKLEPGHYVGTILAFEADSVEQGPDGNVNTTGHLLERKEVEFVVEYAETDRVLCEEDGMNITLGSVLKDLRMFLKNRAELRVGTGSKDWMIKFPKLPDGEEIQVTYMDGPQEEMIGKSYNACVMNGRIVLEGAPEGTYRIVVQSTGRKLIKKNIY